MKTIGIGVDIIDNSRIKTLLKKKKTLLIELLVKKKFLLQKKYQIKQIFFRKDLQLKNHLLKL